MQYFVKMQGRIIAMFRYSTDATDYARFNASANRGVEFTAWDMDDATPYLTIMQEA